MKMIRTARQEEATALTRISFEAKGYWNYPQEYFAIWKDELTITPDYIINNDVHVYQSGNTAIGYYSIVNLQEDLNVSGITIKKGFWLEHMFITPDYIGKGIGAELFHHLQKRCNDKGISELGILADPHARGFYEKMGCRYVGELPSTIEKRTTPYLILPL